jgi:DNA-directed RNA polymerase specialized sigma24 family protein
VVGLSDYEPVREEAVKMAQDEALSVLEISKRLSLPKSTLMN